MWSLEWDVAGSYWESPSLGLIRDVDEYDYVCEFTTEDAAQRVCDLLNTLYDSDQLVVD